MSRIDDLLGRQAEALAGVQEAEARRMLRALADARREVAAQMEALRASGQDRVQRYTAQAARVQMAQIEAAIRALTARLTTEMAAANVSLGERALGDLLSVIRANEREFRDAGGQIEFRVLSRLTQERGLLLHRFSMERYGADLVARIQRELAAGVARSLTIPQLTARIAGTDGVMARMGGRAELIARMETNNAYNLQHQSAMEEAARVLDLPNEPEDRLMRQANEFFDSRNHALSRALDGLVTPLDKPWRVPVARVEAAARGLGIKGKVGGILWPQEGGEYVIGAYPCHFGERGRAVPFRASWEGMPRAAESQVLAVPVRMAA